MSEQKEMPGQSLPGDTQDSSAPKRRKAYAAPRLSKYGDLRDVSKGNFAYAARENQIYTDFAASQ